MKLAELEHYFAAAATSGTGPIAGLDDVFATNERLTASEQLAIYNRAYFYRLLDAMSSVFALSKGVLGATEFERLSLGYLAAHPSEHPAIERVGRNFCTYLAGLGAAPGEPVLSLVALEWARLCALVAPNPPTLVRSLALDPAVFPHCRFSFVPGVGWLEVDARALSAFAGAADAGVTAERCAVVVWRAEHQVHHQPLETAEFRALQAAGSGATMNEVCAAFDTGNEAADSERAFRAIASWFARHWLQKVDIPGA